MDFFMNNTLSSTIPTPTAWIRLPNTVKPSTTSSAGAMRNQMTIHGLREAEG